MSRPVPPYPELVAMARRHARRPEEAEDIVQDVLIAALGAGREDYAKSQNRRWIAGAIRRRAAFDARSAARRRRREARFASQNPAADQPEGEALADILAGLAPSLRVVAALALSGHSRVEIAYLLDISDTALRQRIRALKKALAKKGVRMPEAMVGLNLDLAYGAIRQALLPALRRHGGAFGTHDPDGHIFIFKRSQKS